MPLVGLQGFVKQIVVIRGVVDMHGSGSRSGRLGTSDFAGHDTSCSVCKDRHTSLVCVPRQLMTMFGVRSLLLLLSNHCPIGRLVCIATRATVRSDMMPTCSVLTL